MQNVTENAQGGNLVICLEVDWLRVWYISSLTKVSEGKPSEVPKNEKDRGPAVCSCRHSKLSALRTVCGRSEK